MRVGDIAETMEAKSLTSDIEVVETSLGDRICRVRDEDGACCSDCGSYDCRKVEDP